MSKRSLSPETTGLIISGAYGDLLPNQAWLAEVVRTVSCRLYAQVVADGGRGTDSSIIAVHNAAISGQVRKTFGALIDESQPQLSISWVIELLDKLEDLAHVGRGYYIPRESRVVRLAPGWGRIAGGLALETSEHPEGGVISVQDQSIGRPAKLTEDFSAHDLGTEHSEVLEWISKNVDQLFSELCEKLSEPSASQLPDDSTVYYNPQFRPARSRRDRWQSKLPNAAFAVARSGGLPAHYTIYAPKGAGSRPHWIEVQSEEARKWILLAERIAGATNCIGTRANGSSISFALPDMLPKSWTAAILSCCSSVARTEKGWEVEIPLKAQELAKIVLNAANIQLIAI